MAYVTPQGYTFSSIDEYNNFMSADGPFFSSYSSEDQNWINSWGTNLDPMLGGGLGQKTDILAPVPQAAPVLRDKAFINPLESMANKAGGAIKGWTAAMDTPNLVNAGVTGILTGLASLGTAFSASKMFKLYEQQEQLAIQNSEEQARRLQIKGNILLANMQAKHAITQGKNELAVAGSGAGAISGSFLDKLTANYKYDTRDERTQSFETLWSVSNARREGLVQALSVAGNAMQQAIKNRNNAITGMFSGLKATADSLLADKRQYDTNVANTRNLYTILQQEQRSNESYYGKLDTKEVEATPASLQIESNTGSRTGLIDI